ncbi:MFS transporter [Amorphus sp. 3PC139-8]|uniref:MFS transporter n=1 Tax=Amorphus sp. 3PC139-8 TaxID=2735676 RepID=UPI00345CBB1A
MSNASALRQHPPRRDRGDTATLAVVAVATALVLIIFTTPLATIVPTTQALGASAGQEAWLLAAMPMGAATGLLGAGALGDDRGRRIVFLWGLGVMAVASMIAAAAPTALVVILARIAQGLGGAAVIACGLGLLGVVFPAGRPRVRATGIWAAALGAGVAIGPILAALCTAFGGWRAAYWSTGLLAFALLLAGHAVVPHEDENAPRRVDWLGTALLMAGLAMFMSSLTEMRLGLVRPTVLLLFAGGLLAILVFILVEVRHRDPIIDLALFRHADFAGATFAAFASGAGVLATMSLVPTLLTRTLESSALTAAFVLCAWSATSVVTALGARWIPERITPRLLLVAGLAACAIAQLMLYAPSAEGSVLQVLPSLFLAGAANGVLNAALGRQAVATVPQDRTAMGSGANNTARYLGSAIGITLGAVLIAHGADVGGLPGLLTGWNETVLATAGFSILGAVVVAVARDR